MERSSPRKVWLHEYRTRQFVSAVWPPKENRKKGYVVQRLLQVTQWCTFSSQSPPSNISKTLLNRATTCRPSVQTHKSMRILHIQTTTVTVGHSFKNNHEIKWAYHWFFPQFLSWMLSGLGHLLLCGSLFIGQLRVLHLSQWVSPGVSSDQRRYCPDLDTTQICPKSVFWGSIKFFLLSLVMHPHTSEDNLLPSSK